MGIIKDRAMERLCLVLYRFKSGCNSQLTGAWILAGVIKRIRRPILPGVIFITVFCFVILIREMTRFNES